MTRPQSVFLNLTLLAACTLYLGYVFIGLPTYWAAQVYDDWRLWQLPLFVLAVCYGLQSCRTQAGLIMLADLLPKFMMTLFWPGLFLLASFSIIHANNPAAAITDGAGYVLLASLACGLSLAMTAQPAARDRLGSIVALIPLLTAIWLPISIVLSYVTQEPPGEWHNAFINIRYYNDALLPCLFLLWHHARQRPQYAIVVWLISVLYLLTLWVDGARAVLLGTGCGLLLMGLIKALPWHDLKRPFGSLMFSYALYHGLTRLPGFDHTDIGRSSSSGRWEIWQTALGRWLSHPLTGTGAAPDYGYYAAQSHNLVMHPHNLILQWLAEWGLAGLWALIGLSCLLHIIWQNRHHLSGFVFAGLCAIGINSLLSGTLVYPASQISSAWLIALAISQLSTTAKPLPRNRPCWTSITPYALIALMALLAVHWPDYTQTGKTSETKQHSMAPRFWQYGQTLHLVEPAATETAPPQSK